MQIMPGTAKLITKQYGLKYKDGILTSDPAYNVKLGAAHLGDLIADHGGSYVLTLVSYNAGPRRSREWLQEYGDLRTGETDPIDWVESIPFQETRQYVQKVLQNLHVYRSRLAPKTVRPMTADLARGSTVDTISVSTTEPVAAGKFRLHRRDHRGPYRLRMSFREVFYTSDDGLQALCARPRSAGLRPPAGSLPPGPDAQRQGLRTARTAAGRNAPRDLPGLSRARPLPVCRGSPHLPAGPGTERHAAAARCAGGAKGRGDRHLARRHRRHDHGRQGARAAGRRALQ